jgi:hypothetical protein
VKILVIDVSGTHVKVLASHRSASEKCVELTRPMQLRLQKLPTLCPAARAKVTSQLEYF